MIIAGIDPGKSGALAFLFPDNSVQVFDVPVVKLKGKEEPAWTEWRQSWVNALNIYAPGMIIMEKVASRPGQGVASMFKFGHVMGYAHGLTSAASPRSPIHLVTPNTWKAKLGLLHSDKNASREKARTLLPRASDLLTRVKDDGRAEAILLAYYGRLYLQ